jgi:hypothetical protein
VRSFLHATACTGGGGCTAQHWLTPMRLWVVPSPLHAPFPAGTGPGPVSLRHRALLRYVCEPLGGAELTTCSLDSPEGDVRRQGAAAGASSPTTSPSATSPPRLQQAFITTDPTCGSGSAPNLAGVTGSRPRHSRSVTASSGRVGLHSTPPSRRLYDRLHHVSRFSHPPDWGVVETPPRAPVSCEQDKCAA